MLATLDPLGLPVATEVLSGEKADDPLYVPAIKRVRETLVTSGLLYIGDCKMAAIATRGYLAAGGDRYLCPLPWLYSNSRRRFTPNSRLSLPNLPNVELFASGAREPYPIFRSSRKNERTVSQKELNTEIGCFLLWSLYGLFYLK